MTSNQKEYEHIEFTFTQPSGFRNGKHFETTVFILVPIETKPVLQAWLDAKQAGKTNGQPSGRQLLDTLIKQGALLHKEGGPAYRSVEKSALNSKHSVVKTEEYWEKGVRKADGGPGIKSLGKYTL